MGIVNLKSAMQVFFKSKNCNSFLVSSMVFQPQLNLPLLQTDNSVRDLKLAKYTKVTWIFIYLIITFQFITIFINRCKKLRRNYVFFYGKDKIRTLLIRCHNHITLFLVHVHCTIDLHFICVWVTVIWWLWCQHKKYLSSCFRSIGRELWM